MPHQDNSISFAVVTGMMTRVLNDDQLAKKHEGMAKPGSGKH